MSKNRMHSTLNVRVKNCCSALRSGLIVQGFDRIGRRAIAHAISNMGGIFDNALELFRMLLDHAGLQRDSALLDRGIRSEHPGDVPGCWPRRRH